MVEFEEGQARSKREELDRVQPTLRVADVSKAFGSVPVLQNLSFDVRQGEFLTLLGPSGCGKTTLLNLIAGFFTPDKGVIEISGQDVTALPAHRRDTAMVFQNYALFPHLTVEQNVAFGLRIRKRVPKDEIQSRVAAVLDSVKMGGMQTRYPHALSGGQQQRVALARAIVLQPKLLLLDEPLSNLDANLRESMQIELRGLQREIGITTILVTHDQIEAFVVSDRIAIMHHGQLEQVGTPGDIYTSPRTATVANFIGRMNSLRGRLIAPGTFETNLSGTISRLNVTTECAPGTEGVVLVRPEHIHLSVNPTQADDEFAGLLESVIFLGPTTQYQLRVHRTLILANRSGAPTLQPGPIYVSWPAAQAYFLPNSSED